MTISSRSEDHKTGKEIMSFLRAHFNYQALNVPITKSTVYTDRVVIHTSSKIYQDRLQVIFSEQVSLLVRAKCLPNPKIYIGGIPEEIQTEEVIAALKALPEFNLHNNVNQPNCLPHRVYTKSYSNEYSILVEIPIQIYPSLIKKRILTVSWVSLTMDQSRSASLCLKCGSHRHNGKDCSAKICCLVCAENHETSNCTITEKSLWKCVNCLKANFDSNHTAFSHKCKFNIAQQKFKKSIYGISTRNN